MKLRAFLFFLGLLGPSFLSGVETTRKISHPLFSWPNSFASEAIDYVESHGGPTNRAFSFLNGQVPVSNDLLAREIFYHSPRVAMVPGGVMVSLVPRRGRQGGEIVKKVIPVPSEKSLMWLLLDEEISDKAWLHHLWSWSKEPDPGGWPRFPQEKFLLGFSFKRGDDSANIIFTVKPSVLNPFWACARPPVAAVALVIRVPEGASNFIPLVGPRLVQAFPGLLWTNTSDPTYAKFSLEVLSAVPQNISGIEGIPKTFASLSLSVNLTLQDGQGHFQFSKIEEVKVAGGSLPKAFSAGLSRILSKHRAELDLVLQELRRRQQDEFLKKNWQGQAKRQTQK